MNGEIAAALAAVVRRLEDMLPPLAAAVDRATERVVALATLAGPPVPGPPQAFAPLTTAAEVVRVPGESTARPVVMPVLPPAATAPTGPAVAPPALAAALTPTSAPLAVAPSAPASAAPAAAIQTVVREVGEAVRPLVEPQLLEGPRAQLDVYSFARAVAFRLTPVAGTTPTVAAAPEPVAASLAPASGLEAFVVPVSAVTSSPAVSGTQPTLPGPTPLAPATGGLRPPPVTPVAPPAPPARPAAPPPAPSVAPAERIIRLPEPPPAATEVEVSGQFTFNGGISVQITAETIDLEHAEEVARAIAEAVLEEIERLLDRDRFRAGLPTVTTA
jgi:hypothetical protein